MNAAKLSSIVIVDDQAIVLRAIQRVLAAWSPQLASSAREGIALVQQLETLDAICCDYDLGDGTGLQVLDAAAAAFPGCRRVLISAAPPPDMPDALKRGTAHAFVPKPFETEELLEALGLTGP